MVAASKNAIDEPKMQERLVSLLREFAFEREKYLSRVDACLRRDHRNADALRLGCLTIKQLFTLLLEYGEGLQLRKDTADILRRLDDWGIISDLRIMGHADAPLNLNDQAIKVYDSIDALENCVWGLDFILSKYAKATPAIIIDKNGSESIGTGAIVRFGSSLENRFYLVTNRHVIDPSEGISIKNIDINNKKLEGLVGDWHLCASDDLAAIAIDSSVVEAYFCIHYETSPLQRVITFGYPKIPYADDAYLAFHSGEINTVYQTVQREKMFLISNQVGPGSSGGPVMDDKGLLVGIAAKAFEGKYEPDGGAKINWNAAVTFKRLRKFLEEISGLQDWMTD